MGGGAGASFRTGPGGVGFGLGEVAGGGGGDEEIEGALEGVAEDACSFASRFIRIWGNTSQRLSTRVRDTYTVGIIGGISQRLARAHDRNRFLAIVRPDRSVRSTLVPSVLA